MKRFYTIKDFISHAPKCLFCGANTRVTIGSSNFKTSKSISQGLLLQKVSGQPLYRSVIEKSPLNMSYYYTARVEENKMIFTCTEKYFADRHPPQIYDVMSIDMDNSDVCLDDRVEVGILNSFVRINFKFICICENSGCLGHTFSSSSIIAGAKSKRLMPFFLREECMVGKGADDEDSIIYTLRSDYYHQTSQLVKSSAPNDYANPFVGLASEDPPTNLPLVDLSNIKSKESFQMRVENYVIFS